MGELRLTKRQALAVAGKVVGLYLLLQVILHLPAGGGVLEVPSQWHSFVMIACGVLFITIALFLLVGAERFAGWITRDDDAAESAAIAQVEEVAFTVVGLVVAVTALPRVIGALGSLLLVETSATAAWTAAAPFRDWWHRVIGPCVSCVAGLYLLLGARGLVALLRRVRENGR